MAPSVPSRHGEGRCIVDVEGRCRSGEHAVQSQIAVGPCADEGAGTKQGIMAARAGQALHGKGGLSRSLLTYIRT